MVSRLNLKTLIIPYSMKLETERRAQTNTLLKKEEKYRTRGNLRDTEKREVVSTFHLVGSRPS